MTRPACVLTVLAAVAAARPAPNTASQSGEVRIAGLETDAAVDPVGIDNRRPRFSSRLESSRRGVMQTRVRVLVASAPDRLRPDATDVWDSGEIASAEPFMIYGGPELTPRQRYVWSVRVNASPGLASAWAPPASFETALLDEAEWKGQWNAGPERARTLTVEQGDADDATIRAAGEFCRPVQWLTSEFAAKRVPNNQGECREVRPAPMLRKTFRVTKPVARARIYSTGLAYNDLTLNGRATSDAVLDPAFTDYSRTVLYTTHDVTALIRNGET